MNLIFNILIDSDYRQYKVYTILIYINKHIIFETNSINL